jgi:hypothetical protein
MRLFHFITAAVLIAFCFCSCATYNNTIVQRERSFDPLYYDVTNLDAYGKPTPVYDSIYYISPTWKQAYQKTKGKGYIWAATGLTAGAFGSAFTPAIATGLPAVGSIVGLSIVGEDYEWNKWNSDKPITKFKYDSLKAMGVKDIYSAIN